MKDTHGNIIAGARIAELDELVMRLPRGSVKYYIMFEGDGAVARIASFHACLPAAEKDAERFRNANPDFVIRIQPITQTAR